MSGTIEALKLFAAFASGVGLIWTREYIAGRLDRARKREALWRACEGEAPGAYMDFENTAVLRDLLERGRPVGGVFHASMIAAKLAERLLEFDSANASAYLPFVIRTEQAEQRANDMRALFVAHAKLTPEERLVEAPRMVSELFFSARAIAWLYSDRLRVLRVLKAAMPNESYAGSFIADVEDADRKIQEKLKAWEEERDAQLTGPRPWRPR